MSVLTLDVSPSTRVPERSPPMSLWLRDLGRNLSSGALPGATPVAPGASTLV